MMTLHEIAECEARANAATPGPWKCWQLANEAHTNYCRIRTSSDEGMKDTLHGYCFKANARFIAAARSDVPALCETARRAIELLQRVRYADARTEREIKDFLAQVTKE